MTIGLMLALFAGFLCLGMPIAHGMGLAAVLALLYEGNVPILLLAQRVYRPLGMRSTSLPSGSRLPRPFAHGYIAEPPGGPGFTKKSSPSPKDMTPM